MRRTQSINAAEALECPRKRGAAARVARVAIIHYRRDRARWVWLILDRFSREEHERGSAQTKTEAKQAAIKAKHAFASRGSTGW